MKKKLIVVGVIILLAAGGYAGWKVWSKKKAAVNYRTAVVERGDVIQTVRATGNVKPTRLVQVGTQVNGPVKKLYVDYNDRVKSGDLLAQIDPSVYEARLAQDKANLAQCEASLQQSRAKLAQAEKELDRAKQLAERQMLSQADLDAAIANREILAAQVKLSEAGIQQAQASLNVSQANLDYTTIKSPVDGVVISRNVDEGQTVVASMSAQVLYQVAMDLLKVQIEASIPEADIGKIKTGQPATFTVDAYDVTFTGNVFQIRMAAATIQNVVTYPVIVLADNPDMKLFPGMTANIVVETARSENVMKIPNGALRFKPDDSAIAQDSREKTGGADKQASGERRPDNEKRGHDQRRSKVWIQEKPGELLKMVKVATGITDGSFSEVKEPSDLKAGQSVIVGVLAPGETQTAASNPFIPQMPRPGGGPRR